MGFLDNAGVEELWAKTKAYADSHGGGEGTSFTAGDNLEMTDGVLNFVGRTEKVIFDGLLEADADLDVMGKVAFSDDPIETLFGGTENVDFGSCSYEKLIEWVNDGTLFENLSSGVESYEFSFTEFSANTMQYSYGTSKFVVFKIPEVEDIAYGLVSDKEDAFVVTQLYGEGGEYVIANQVAGTLITGFTRVTGVDESKSYATYEMLENAIDEVDTSLLPLIGSTDVDADDYVSPVDVYNSTLAGIPIEVTATAYDPTIVDYKTIVFHNAYIEDEDAVILRLTEIDDVNNSVCYTELVGVTGYSGHGNWWHEDFNIVKLDNSSSGGGGVGKQWVDEDGNEYGTDEWGDSYKYGEIFNVSDAYTNEASGFFSHAEGGMTVASGFGSHAEGGMTVASGFGSHAEGVGTVATGAYSHVEGAYNIVDDSVENGENTGQYLHIAGNGLTRDGYFNPIPSNAYTLDWSGNANFAGDVYVNSHWDKVVNGYVENDGKKLATEEFVLANAGGDGAPEVHVGTEAPTDEGIKLWVDTDAEAPAGGSNGIFWVERKSDGYADVSFDDITNAVEAGMIPVLKFTLPNGTINVYTYIGHGGTTEEHNFARVTAAGSINEYYVLKTGYINQYRRNVLSTDDRASSITDSNKTSTTYVPSVKAVVDYIDSLDGDGGSY